MKVLRRLVTFLVMLFPFFAHAVGEEFTQEKLSAFNKSGKSALVFVYAEWCPTCRAQEKILGEILNEREFKDLSTLRVNFDAQKKDLRKLGVSYQSTLIVFKGGKEVARVTGETDRERIAGLLRKAL